MKITKKLQAEINTFNSREANIKYRVPLVTEYMEAFEKYIGHDNYKIEIFESSVLFKVKDKTYIVDTYQGLTALLHTFVEGRSYEELYTMTSSSFWSEIYCDPGIDKVDFLPAMLHRWEEYWEAQEQEFGKKDHIIDMKEKSWRKLQVFNSAYEGSDPVKLAENVDFTFVPLVILTMLDCYDKESRFSEYCEFEFFSNQEHQYEYVKLTDDEVNDVWMFFIRETDEYE